MIPDLSTPAKKKAFAESQQMPAYQPSMKDLENTWRLQSLRCKEDRLAAAAREIPEVAELIDENKVLKKGAAGSKTTKPAK